jgi:hypothetical protein
MIRTARRVLGASALAVAATLALQAPALADTVLVDDAGHATPPSTVDNWTVTMNGGWWNVVTIRGYTWDYDLNLKNPAGQSVGTSTLGSYQMDFVAVNANDACSGKSGAGYTAVASPFGRAPATPGDGGDGYAISRRAGGHIISVVPKTSADQFTVLQYFDQRDVALFDVFLEANTTYRVAWNSVQGYYEGGLFLFAGANSSGSNCFRSRSTTSPLLWHNIEHISGTRSGETRFTSSARGWYGLLLFTQTWDLTQVSIGGGDSQPHIMVKPA